MTTLITFLFRFFLVWFLASILIVGTLGALIAYHWPKRRPR